MARQRWFTSDTHFGHKNIIKYCDRPFGDVDEMNKVMRLKWNAVVAPDDVVFHLGDVALGDIEKSLPIIGQLNGYKVLVPGNHDRLFSLEKPAKRVAWKVRYEEVFDTVMPEQLRLVLQDGTPVQVSHFPYVGDSHDGDRFESLRPKDDGNWILHGHVHEKWKVRDRQVNVGVDVWNFYPVAEEDIVRIIHGEA